MASLPTTLAILFLAQVASCQPSISFPFNAQLPLAARIDEFFSYSFSPYTFTSGSKITYSLGNGPSWLSIESSTRRLYGTPRDSDVAKGEVVGQPVDIIATDSTGSTTMSATVVVSRSPPPTLQVPLSKQIENFGKFSAPSSILSYPSTPFKFKFDRDTFGKAGLNYYATSGNSSPLPAWVKFDASTLTFSGQTPPFESLVQPPQTFDLQLVASDVVGFSAASLSFSIVVGSHKLTANNPIVTLNASRGSELTYDGLEKGIQLDGKQVGSGDVDVTTSNIPKWLSWDPKTLKLQGTPGPGDHSSNFTVSFHDPFADSLDVIVIVNVASGLFESTLGDLQVQPGADFSVDLSKYFKTPDDVQIKVTTSPSEDWLKVDGLKLSGRVPRTAKGAFKLTIEASSKSSSLKETETVGVEFLAVDGTTATMTTASATSTSATAAPTQTNSTVADSTDAPTSGHMSTSQILLATIIPIIFITILLMALVCFFRRRRAHNNYLSKRYRRNISSPLPNTSHSTGSDPSMREIEHMAGVAHTETHMPKTPNEGYTVVHSDNSHSSLRPSSETLGQISDPELPRALLASSVRTATSRGLDGSSTGDDNRQSWITVEGDAATTAARSIKSARTNMSEATFAGPAHQVLPTPSFLAESRNDDFRSGLDFTIPSLGDMEHVPPGTAVEYKPPKRIGSHQSLDARSTITSSSAALPTGFESMQKTVLTEDASAPNWETLAESEVGDTASQLRKPDRAFLGSQPAESSQLYGADSAMLSRELTGDVSFGSSENWRVIGRQGTVTSRPSPSYKSLVESAPFHPSRPSTARDGARPGERASPDPTSSSQWTGDDALPSRPIRPSISLVPKDSGDEDDEQDEGHASAAAAAPLPHNTSEFASSIALEPPTLPMTWSRDQSGNQLSDGSGSFKVFL
ncbi:polarity establishment/cellular polarization [Purpureocillium takamizusanense]|uniref:Polarity establishment/cellular polarization n=1 Tax=Purpureocillium takamizusanense TaxID=2060973 RepID=A0A9Q8VDE8_9HYPO|nr:polarity establishment/cellular polarization [Purpureocillium takamizusanense]UNI20824.1 polarity establishment/cellular polarization [Purpureocillium takamizusanense]